MAVRICVNVALVWMIVLRAARLCGDSRVHMASKRVMMGTPRLKSVPMERLFVTFAMRGVKSNKRWVPIVATVPCSSVDCGWVNVAYRHSNRWSGFTRVGRLRPGANNEPVTCSSLHPDLGNGFARCGDGCMKYDTGLQQSGGVFVPADLLWGATCLRWRLQC